MHLMRFVRAPIPQVTGQSLVTNNPDLGEVTQPKNLSICVILNITGPNMQKGKLELTRIAANPKLGGARKHSTQRF